MKTIDVKTGDLAYVWARHPCKTGLVPANGLVYTMPQGCARCGGGRGGIRGFLAVASDDPAREKELEIKDSDRLQKGPAFAKATADKPANEEASPKSDEWPIFRHDSQRSCVTKDAASLKMKKLWDVQVDDQKRPFQTMALEWLAHRLGGDKLTSPTIADGKVFVSIVDSHRVAALDATTGKPLWTFSAGGRLDTSPTIYRGLCLFGSYDGWVYCLRASDGAEVWRFNAAFKEKRFPAFGQLESVSPVIGGVLVQDGKAFVLAGRFARGTEGGGHLYALDPFDGKLLNAQHSSGKLEPDILVSDGVAVRPASSSDIRYTLQTAPQADPEVAKGHLYVIRPLLNRAWRYHGSRNTHLDKKDMNKFFFWGHVGQVTIGDPLRKRTFAYKFFWKKPLFPDSEKELGGSLHFWNGQGKIPAQCRANSEVDPGTWSIPVPHPSQIESLVLAGNTLLAAGPLDKYHREKGAFLRAYNPDDGSLKKEWKLRSPPVADGLAVAYGRLYVSCQDGKLLCFGK